MIIKKFTAKTEKEATMLAVSELGSSVVIMNVKTIKPKGFFAFFKPSQVELTAAVEEESDNPPPAPAVPKKAVRQATMPLQSFPDVLPDEEPETKPVSKEENGNIEAKLESLHSLIEASLVKETEEQDFTEEKEQPKNDASDMLRFMKLIYNTLLENEVDERYANEIISELELMNRPGTNIDQMLANLYQKMILKFGKANTIQPSKEGPKVIFFVGPTGVGKTTTIAKIASNFCVDDKKKVALVTTDTYRIAAAEQLKIYANILNTPFSIVYTAKELVNAYKEQSDYDYILVDTAGHSPKNEDLKKGTNEFVHALDELTKAEVYLVLSATTKYKDLIAISDMYAGISSFKLIFTKLDETEKIGNLWNIKQRTGAEMSYITTGQNVPDDIAAFNPQAMVKQLLGGDK